MPLSPPTRYSLIIRLRNREDAEAWNAFVEIYEPIVHQMMRRSGLQPVDATEQTQEVMTAVIEAINRWRPDAAKGKFRTWLFRISRNILADYWKRSIRQPVTGLEADHLGLAEEGDSDTFDPEFQRQTFVAVAQKIKPQFAAPTWLAFWRTTVEGQPVETVAKSLSLSPGNVYVARCRVMKKLQEAVRSFLRSEFEDRANGGAS